MPLQQVAVERCRQVQLRFAFTRIDLGGDDEFTARKRRRSRQDRTATLAQQVAPAFAPACHADAIRVRERQQQTHRLVTRKLRLTRAARHAVAGNAPGKQFAGTSHLLQGATIESVASRGALTDPDALDAYATYASRRA